MNPSYYPENKNPFSSNANNRGNVNQGFSSNSDGLASSSNSLSNDEKIFFVAIIRYEETLVKFAHFSGNYDEILIQVLPKIVKTNGIKMTLNYEK